MSVGLGLGLFFVRLFRFSILFSGSALTILFLCCLLLLLHLVSWVLRQEIGYRKKNVSEVTYFVLSET